VITISQENIVDYGLTARIATEAFASSEVRFSPERMKWLYEHGFGHGITVVAATDDGKKIGQIALVDQNVFWDGEPRSAIQLIDLFVLKAYRSPQLIRRLYKEVEHICSDRNIRLILAMPNKNSMLLNARFLKLNPFLWLQIRAGVSVQRPTLGRLRYSGYLKSMTKEAAVGLLSDFSTPAEESGLHWDGETLFNRINDPTCDYAVHASADLLLLSSSRRTKGFQYTLFSGFFARPDAVINYSDIRDLIRAACRFWKLPIFVFVGTNRKLPKLPGFPLPARFRPPMLVQLRDTHAEKTDVRFDRFQLIDSDFA
jgi:GNAT superfamily N-acetyltransferase